MNEKEQVALQKVLQNLSSGHDEPLATLAEALILDAQTSDQSLEGPKYKEMRERISSAVEQLTTNGYGPGTVLEALIKIDMALVSEDTITIPWATRFTPLAAERALHAQRERWCDEIDNTLSNNSPIFRTGQRTMVAVPVGLVGADALHRFADRILQESLSKRTKRVTLVLDGLDEAAATSLVWKDLKDDLAAQKVRLDRIHSRSD